MPCITRQFTFDAAHRLLGHEGKCKHIHGHTYKAEVTIQSKQLDDLGRVVDFAKVKELIGGWIEDHWDHNIILHPEDPIFKAVHMLSGLGSPIATEIWVDKYPYVMSPWMNPTAENMAFILWEVSQFLLTPMGLHVTQVRIYETPNCWADYQPETLS